MADAPPPDGLEWALGGAITLIVAAFSWVAQTFRKVFEQMGTIRKEAREEAHEIAKGATAENRDIWNKVNLLEAKIDRGREEQHQMELRLLQAINGGKRAHPAE